MDGTRKTILSEITQTQKDKHGMYKTPKWILDVKQKITGGRF